MDKLNRVEIGAKYIETELKNFIDIDIEVRYSEEWIALYKDDELFYVMYEEFSYEEMNPTTVEFRKLPKDIQRFIIDLDKRANMLMFNGKLSEERGLVNYKKYTITKERGVNV